MRRRFGGGCGICRGESGRGLGIEGLVLGGGRFVGFGGGGWKRGRV